MERDLKLEDESAFLILGISVAAACVTINISGDFARS